MKFRKFTYYINKKNKGLRVKTKAFKNLGGEIMADFGPHHL